MCCPRSLALQFQIAAIRAVLNSLLRSPRFIGMSSVPPPVLTPEARATKRQIVRHSLLRQHEGLILMYQDLLHFLPDPYVPSSKREWETQMCNARTIFRAALACDEEGDRRPLHNYILTTHEKLLLKDPTLWTCIQDPSDECTDSEWLRASLRSLLTLKNMARTFT